MKHQPSGSSTWEHCTWNKLMVYYVLLVKNKLHILYKCCPASVGLNTISDFYEQVSHLFWQLYVLSPLTIFHIKFGLLSEVMISWPLSLMWLSHSSCDTHCRTATTNSIIICFYTMVREERKLRVFENRVLRKIFGPRRDEVTGNGGDCITRS